MATGFNAYIPLVANMSKNNDSHVLLKINSLTTLVLLLAFAIVLSWANTRFSMEFDWTRESRHSLSETSIQILNQITGPVHITAYARDDLNLRDAVRRYVAKYQAIKPEITLSFINPDRSPDIVRKLGIQINGELVFEYQGRTENVRTADENTIINSLVRLSREHEQWIAYVIGHGERNFIGQANHDLGEFGQYLIGRGYKIHPLNLVEIQTIPDNTSILALTGSQLPLLAGETKIILDYLRRGGNLLWLLDPGDNAQFSELTEYLDLNIADGTAIDIAGQFIGINDPTITMITTSLYGTHPVVDGFKFTTLFPKAAVILPTDSQAWSTMPLLMTADHTWLESGSLVGEVEFNPDTDLQGPLSIGQAISRQIGMADNDTAATKEQKIIVIGDGDFLSNTYIANSGNLDLGVRIVEWLSQDENLIDIPVRSATDTQLTISSVRIGIIGIILLIILPLFFISIGIYTGWKLKRA